MSEEKKNERIVQLEAALEALIHHTGNLEDGWDSPNRELILSRLSVEAAWAEKILHPPVKNYMLDVAFEIEGPWDNFSEIPFEELVAGMKKRLLRLQESLDREAFGCSDVYDV